MTGGMPFAAGNLAFDAHIVEILFDRLFQRLGDFADGIFRRIAAGDRSCSMPAG